MAEPFKIYGDIGVDGNTLPALETYLSENPDHAEIQINSGGGIAIEGSAMAAALSQAPSSRVTVMAAAFSAASLICMGAREIVMHSGAMMMIHNPAGMAFGTSASLRQAADTLDKMSGVYAAVYAKRSGNPVTQVSQWMDEELWMDADEAVAMGFADTTAESAERVTMAYSDLTGLQNVPDFVMREMKAHEQKGP